MRNVSVDFIFQNTSESNNETYKFPFETEGYIAFCVSETEFIAGFLGNIISLLVWTKGRQTSNLGCSTFFILLSCCDCLCMIYNIVFAFRFLPVNLDIYPGLGGLGNLACILITTLGTLLPQLSTWIIVCICLEGMLSIRFPLQIKTEGCRKRVKIAFVLLLLILTGFVSTKHTLTFKTWKHSLK